MSDALPMKGRGAKLGQPKQTTRGRWIDTQGNTIYESSLRYAVTAVGGSQSDYYRCWRALRKKGRWPADVPIRPATIAETCAALRTVVYEVEMVLPLLSAHTIEEVVLKSGGWLRRIDLEKVPQRTRLNAYRCVWLVSGLVSLEWLEKLVDANYGRLHEVDEGQYRVVLR